LSISSIDTSDSACPASRGRRAGRQLGDLVPQCFFQRRGGDVQEGEITVAQLVAGTQALLDLARVAIGGVDQAPASLLARSRYWSPACLTAMPISSSSKACRGDTVFFGAAVVEVAIMGGPAQFRSLS
jgi:hypothetical protein